MSIDTIAAWMQDVLGSTATVVIANQNGPQVDGPYIELLDLTSHDLGYPQQEAVPNTGAEAGTATVYSEQFEELTLQVNAYASNGHDLLKTIVNEAYLPECPADVCLIESGDIRNLTALEDTAFVPRYECDMTFGTSFESTSTTAEVDTVHITSDDFAEMDSEIGEEPGD